MVKKELTVWEAACIITGYGIGGGVLAMPYLVEKNGIAASFVILAVAFAASWTLHMMIADAAQKCGPDMQIVSILSRFLFRGKSKVFLTLLFFALMAFILVTNLAAYIAGAAEVLAGIIPIPLSAARLIFYVLAAAVVLFGLKAVGVSEKIAVAFIFALIGALAIASFFVPGNPLPFKTGGVKDALAFFGMAMFAFSAFYSIPQAVAGLKGDGKKIKKAVFLGFLNNFIMITVITVCALYASQDVTEVAITGWSRGIGQWAQIAGGLFTFLAMLTTYWSISLALADIIKEQLRLQGKSGWVIATAPSLVLSMLDIGGFIDFLEMAGGAIAISVAVMVIPAYRNAKKEFPEGILKFTGKTWVQILVAAAYVLMAVGSVVSL